MTIREHVQAKYGDNPNYQQLLKVAPHMREVFESFEAIGHPELERAPEPPKPQTYQGKLNDWRNRRAIVTSAKINGQRVRPGVEEALEEEWGYLKPHHDCDSDYCPWHGRGDE